MRKYTYVLPEIHKKRTPVLVINSYAGSLVLGAKAMGHAILGSYEDAGYGLSVQRANFRDLDYRATTADWPAKNDLSDKIVLAHPPCAAFSSMTVSVQGHHGIDAEKFQCTKRVLDYAMGHGAAGIAVESVMGAYLGAKAVHEAYAKQHGYHLFRILQNAVTFKLPQWRERFWCLFVRKDLRDTLDVQHYPEPSTIADILEAEPTETEELLTRKWKEQRQRLTADFGASTMLQLAVRRKYGTGALGAVLKRYLKEARGVQRDLLDVSKQHVVWGAYQSNTPRVLDPAGYAPVLLHHSFWTANGRPLSMVEYKRIMGFPDTYRFEGRDAKLMRGYLSRGVCPPVAAWVLDTLERNLNFPRSYYQAGKPKPAVISVLPGGTADLRPSKKLWASVLADEHKERATC